MIIIYNYFLLSMCIKPVKMLLSTDVCTNYGIVCIQNFS